MWILTSRYCSSRYYILRNQHVQGSSNGDYEVDGLELTVFKFDRDCSEISAQIIKNRLAHMKLTSSPLKWQIAMILSSETD
jgi:hypothetical protein